jgi:hypothetical protein
VTGAVPAARRCADMIAEFAVIVHKKLRNRSSRRAREHDLIRLAHE